MEQRREEARFGLLAVELVVEIGGSQDTRGADANRDSGPIRTKSSGMVNISNSGMFIPLDIQGVEGEPWHRGTPVKIAWDNPPLYGEGMEKLAVDAFLRHSKEGYGIGVEFSNLDKKTRNKLREWVDFLAATSYDGETWPRQVWKDAINAFAIIVTTLGVGFGLWGILTVNDDPARANFFMYLMLASIFVYAALRLVSSLGDVWTVVAEILSKLTGRKRAGRAAR